MRPLHRITFLSALLSAAVLPSLATAAKPKTGTPAKSDAVAPAVPEAEKEGKIPGMSISRSNGTWLGLRVEGGMFVLSFYDAKKKPVAADAIRASAKWNPPQKIGSVTCMLAPGADGTTLVGNKFVAPPHILKVYFSLFGSEEKLIESFVVDYRDAVEAP